MWYSIKRFFGAAGWLCLFALAWVWCVIEDEIWTPIWWYFNKHKYTRRD